MILQQKSFAAGFNLIANDTQLADGEYRWVINARQRFGYIEPNRKAILFDDAPEGLKQGGIGIGDVSIIFVAGEAFWRREGTTGWTQIPGFLMDTLADRLWAIAVPDSTFNFKRQSDTSIKSPIIVPPNVRIAGTPAGILVQDGAHQPWIILLDPVTNTFIARVTKNYSQWSNASSVADDREYVPIGKFMMFMNQILFIVSSDGSQVYRSVSGRPLDFMVNVDFLGNKAATELQGGAASVSFAMDNDTITNITPCNVADTFIYGTAHNVRLLVFDYLNTIFGEPTFREAMPAMEAGIVNDQSVLEILGDFCFIDAEGVKTFNAVSQLRFEGQNSTFSVAVSRLFKGKNNLSPIKQKKPVCISFDNYALFDVDTRWGRLIIVYDTLIDKWVAIDIIAFTGRIKQFWKTVTEDETRLYVVTARDKLYQLYADEDNREVAELRIKALEHDETKVQQKGNLVHVMVEKGQMTGKMEVFQYVDDQLKSRERQTVSYVKQNLTSGSSGVAYPVRCPVFPTTYKRSETLTFAFTNGFQGKKIAHVIKWNTDAKVQEVEVITSDIGADSPATQQNPIAQSRNG